MGLASLDPLTQTISELSGAECYLNVHIMGLALDYFHTYLIGENASLTQCHPTPFAMFSGLLATGNAYTNFDSIKQYLSLPVSFYLHRPSHWINVGFRLDKIGKYNCIRVQFANGLDNHKQKDPADKSVFPVESVQLASYLALEHSAYIRFEYMDSYRQTDGINCGPIALLNTVSYSVSGHYLRQQCIDWQLVRKEIKAACDETMGRVLYG